MTSLTLYVLHIALAAVMIWIARKRGLESALPFFCACMLLFPREAQLPAPGIFDITVQRTLILVLAVLYLGDRQLRDKRRGPTPLRWLMAASLVWALVVNLYSIVPLASAKRVLSTIFEYYLTYILLFRIISKTETIRKMLVSMVLAMTVAAVLGLLEAYTRFSYVGCFPSLPGLFDAFRGPATLGPRVQSAFQHPILFGGAIALTVPQALHLLAGTRDGRKQAALWVAVLLMLGVSYKTMSRGPWLGLVLGFLLLLAFYRPLRARLMGIGAAVLTGLLLRPGVYDTLKGIWISTFDPATQMGRSYSYRYALFKVIFDTLDKDPFRQIVGFGQNSFHHLNLQEWFFDRYYTFLSCDCAWVAFAIETGYVGFAVMLLLLGAAWLMAWRSYRTLPEPERYFPLVIAINLASYYFMMVSVAMYDWGQNTHHLWILIAMSAAYGTLVQADETKEVES